MRNNLQSAHTPCALYTTEALQAGICGIVLVSFQVLPDGNPSKVEVIRGLGYGLDEKAVEVVRQWRFRPGTKGAVPVTVGPLKVAVSFRRPVR
jgi:protein TonB